MEREIEVIEIIQSYIVLSTHPTTRDEFDFKFLEFAQTRAFINIDCRPGRKSMLFQSTGGWITPYLRGMKR
jgi:hypothetical protein